MKGGVIVIGSLLWDDKVPGRKNWWKKLDFAKKTRIALPIRYGRSSSENRKHTYSMVFSKELELKRKLGCGYIIPFQNVITTPEDFKSEVIEFAKVEGFKGNRIAANWGVICLKINPRIDKENLNIISGVWNTLVKENAENRGANQTVPNINDFGAVEESKSITENWMLNLNNKVFVGINSIDFLMATSNALKHRKTFEIKYPAPKEIARAIYEGNYYEYFLRNRIERITTFEDRLISKILRKKYRVKLKNIRKIWI